MHTFLGALAPSFNAWSQGGTSTFPTSGQVSFTTSATAYNNATPSQMIASTSWDACQFAFRFSANNATATRTSTVVEIMAGSAGNEYSIIGPVSIGYRGGVGMVVLPIYIPQGTRLSIRVRSARTSTAFTFFWNIGYIPNRDMVGMLPSRWIAYGMNDDASANAQGTIVVPGNASWGSWTSLTTSTTYAHDLWMPMVDGGTATVLTALQRRTQWVCETTADAATAATNGTVWAGPWTVTNTSEQMGDGIVNASATGTMIQGLGGGHLGLFYAPKPAGSAVSVRALASGAPDTNGLGCSILAAI